jgi:phosphatidylserine/phosphatidylglycerophosphate/cardiolipin synthase-like enzyme
VPGNSIRLLKDARENYPAWLDAIAGAKRFIHFESYIIHDDAVGDRFSDALIARARDGVPVRVIYDWMAASARPRAASGGDCAPEASRCAATTRRLWRVRWAGSAATIERCSRSTAR